MRLRPTHAMLCLTALGCTPATDSVQTDHTDVIDTDSPWVRPEGGTIVFEMSDGVTVPADYYPASEAGRPAVLLMSCLYLDSSRKDWPSSIIDPIIEQDVTVLVPDLRGCGESTGSGRDNSGALGILDVRTYVGRARGDGYSNVSIVAGTLMAAAVSAYAYQEELESRPLPASITYLTPNAGSPELLVKMEQVPVVPSLFLIVDGDTAWGKRVENLGNEEWEFRYYGGSELDTSLFDYFPESVGHLLEFHDRLWAAD